MSRAALLGPDEDMEDLLARADADKLCLGDTAEGAFRAWCALQATRLALRDGQPGAALVFFHQAAGLVERAPEAAKATGASALAALAAALVRAGFSPVVLRRA